MVHVLVTLVGLMPLALLNATVILELVWMETWVMEVACAQQINWELIALPTVLVLLQTELVTQQLDNVLIVTVDSMELTVPPHVHV